MCAIWYDKPEYQLWTAKTSPPWHIWLDYQKWRNYANFITISDCSKLISLYRENNHFIVAYYVYCFCTVVKKIISSIYCAVCSNTVFHSIQCLVCDVSTAASALIINITIMSVNQSMCYCNSSADTVKHKKTPLNILNFHANTLARQTSSKLAYTDQTR